MRTLNICKAQPMPEQVIEKSQITFEDDLPRFSDPKVTKMFADGQAFVLEKALFEVLPGCIYDRLAGYMLKRISCQLIVSHNR